MAPDDHLMDEVRRTVDDLDRLLADASQGRLSVTRREDHIDQVRAAAARLNAAASGPGRPINPPGWISADGTKAGW